MRKHHPYAWLEELEGVVSEYEPGQKENETNNHLVEIGRPRSGKNHTGFWLLEHGLRRGDTKLVEAHLQKPTHLEEILSLAFPNGFFDVQDAVDEVEQIEENMEQDRYTDRALKISEIRGCLTTLDEDPLHEMKDDLERLVDKAENRNIRLNLERALESVERARDKIRRIHDFAGKDNVPDTFSASYIHGGADQYAKGFNVKIFTPITAGIPDTDVPSQLFEPFAFPVDDYQRFNNMEEGLRVIHGDKYDTRKTIYYKTVSEGETTFADLKNKGGLTGREAKVHEIEYGDGEKIESSHIPLESNALTQFQRDWAKMFEEIGLVCPPGFDHNLRPKLKEVLLDDDTDVIALYTGFISSKTKRKFTITYFIETMSSIIQNLSREEAKKLDHKFHLHLLETQDIITDSSSRKMQEQDRAFNEAILELMNDSGHYSTDFVFDVKPDEVTDFLVEKSDHVLITQADRSNLNELDLKNRLQNDIEEAMNNDLYSELPARIGGKGRHGYGFVVPGMNYVPGMREPQGGSGDNAAHPGWKDAETGKKTYGCRTPCPRMTSNTPVDLGDGQDWSFFLDRLDYEGESLQKYVEELFEAREAAEEEYVEGATEEEREKEERIKELERERQETRKTWMRAKMREHVGENGVPEEWMPVAEEIRDRVVDRFSDHDDVDDDYQVQNVLRQTQDLRQELEADQEDRVDEAVTLEKVQEWGRKAAETWAFVKGNTSTDAKKNWLKDQITLQTDLSADEAEELSERACQKALEILQAPKAENIPDSWTDDGEKFYEVVHSNLNPKVSLPQFQDWVENRKQARGEIDEESSDSSTNDSEKSSDSNTNLSGNPGNGVTDSEHGSGNSVADIEEPGEDWDCECGAWNPEDRATCRSCGERYDKEKPVTIQD